MRKKILSTYGPKYYNIRLHKTIFVIYLIVVIITCMFVFPYILKFVYSLFDGQLSGWEYTKEIIDGEVVYKGSEGLGVLPDFMGGLVGILIGFIIDAAIVESLKRINVYQTLIVVLNKELSDIKCLIQKFYDKFLDLDKYVPKREIVLHILDGLGIISFENWEIDKDTFNSYRQQYDKMNNSLRYKKGRFSVKDCNRMLNSFKYKVYDEFENSLNAYDAAFDDIYKSCFQLLSNNRQGTTFDYSTMISDLNNKIYDKTSVEPSKIRIHILDDIVSSGENLAVFYNRPQVIPCHKKDCKRLVQLIQEIEWRIAKINDEFAERENSTTKVPLSWVDLYNYYCLYLAINEFQNATIKFDENN